MSPRHNITTKVLALISAPITAHHYTAYRTVLSPVARGAVFLLSLLSLAGAAVHGPVSGHVYDKQVRGIRPVLGIPGAAFLGESLATPPLQEVFTAPGQSHAFVRTEDGSHAVVQFKQDGGWTFVPIDGDLLQPDLTAVTENGDCAVLYSARDSQAQLIRDLAGLPLVGPRVNLQLPGSTFTAMAVDPSGSNLLAAVADAEETLTGSLYSFDLTNGKSLRIAPVSRVTAIRFSSDGQYAVVTDQGAAEILLLKQSKDAYSLSILAGTSDGLVSPQDAIMIGQARDVIIAESTAPRLYILSLATWTLEVLDLPVVARNLEILNRQHTLLLNQPGADPLHLLETRPEYRLSFVPAR